MTSLKTREILERTGEDRAQLLDSVQGLSAEQMNHRPSEDSWSISEVLHHLVLSHEATVKLMSGMLRRSKEEEVGPDPDPERSVVNSIDEIVASANEAKASAPEIVLPKSHLDSSEALARLAESRKKLESIVEGLSAFDLTKLTFRHPFFGELDTYQWLLVTGWHERRHTRQIERIRESAS